MATRLIEKVMDVAFGHETRNELQQFLSLFGALLGQLNHNQSEMQAFFSSDAVTFLLVTSPAAEALTEARFFAKRAGNDLGMHVSGFILNRSLAAHRHRGMPTLPAESLSTHPELAGALEKLLPLAEQERDKVARHHRLAVDITQEISGDTVTCVLPNLGPDASTIPGLVRLAQAVISPNNIVHSSSEKTS